jgi:hypothetical protein
MCLETAAKTDWGLIKLAVVSFISSFRFLIRVEEEALPFFRDGEFFFRSRARHAF